MDNRTFRNENLEFANVIFIPRSVYLISAINEQNSRNFHLMSTTKVVLIIDTLIMNSHRHTLLLGMTQIWQGQ